jgi:hypothetical protein
MGAISGETAVVTASLEAVRRQYQSSSIAIRLTGGTKSRIDDKKQEQQTVTIWTDGINKSDHKQLISAFKKYELVKTCPDYCGLQTTMSDLAPIWQHVIWLDLGVQLQNGKRTGEAIVCYAQGVKRFLEVESDNNSAAWSSLAELIGVDKIYPDAVAHFTYKKASKEVLDYMLDIVAEIEAKMGTPWGLKDGDASSLVLTKRR